MCGFIGYFGDKFFDLKNASNSIFHRGPDNQKIFTNDHYSIAFNRLSILDLSARAMQPFKYRDITVFFNGEIYNYIELIDIYKNEFASKTSCDGEILPFLFNKYGISFLNKINGMFSIVIIDEHNKEYYLCRDRFGKKPLYYIYKNNNFFFGSEIKAIQKIIKVKISKENLCINLSCWNQIDPLTCYENLFSVSPGHFIKIKKNLVHKNIQWYFPEIKKNIDVKEKFLFLLKDSVRLRLRSDVSMGIFLSGGLDSLSIMTQVNDLKASVTPFNCYIEDKHLQEQNTTDNKIPIKFCKDKNIDLIIENLSFDYWNKNILKIVNNYENIFLDQGILIYYLLAEKAKNKNIKVIFSGNGGDEIFGGYPWQMPILKSVFLKQKLKFGFQNQLNKLHNYLSFNNHAVKKIRNKIRLHLQPKIWFARSFSNAFEDDIEDQKINVDNKINSILNETFSKYQNLITDPANLINYNNFFTVLNHSNLDIDLACMFNSIENRTPLLDYRIVELLMGVPAKIKNNEDSKSLLKSFLVDKLPDYVLDAPKSGPTPFLGNWMMKFNKEHLLSFIYNSKDLIGDCCSSSLAEKISKFNYPFGNNAGKLFALISLILWLKKNAIGCKLDSNLKFSDYI